jgi:hypothetical protein
MTMISMKLVCIKCKYTWTPRKKPVDVRECPSCKSRYWNNGKKA